MKEKNIKEEKMELEEDEKKKEEEEEEADEMK